MTAPASLDELRELLAPIMKRLNEGVQGDEVAAAQAAAAAAQTSVGLETQGQPQPSRLLSFDDRQTMRDALRKQSDNALMRIFGEQASRKGNGIPLEVWLAQGGQARIAGFEMGMQQQVDPEIVRLLDTNNSGPLIRQDLEPVLWELFVRDFPAVDRFGREPANGLVHTYQQMTSFGDAQFMPELGTVTDDRGAYVRQTTNIAILATRRGVSLKNQFATLQSGSGFNPQDLELRAGLRAMSNRLQHQIFSGHSTDSGGTESNELGAYDANAFTGLRSILNTSRAKIAQFDLDAAVDPFRIGVNDACIEIMNISPGRPSVIYMNPIEKGRYDESQDKNIRYVSNLVNVSPGVNTNAVNTIFGDLPLIPVPGTAIGTYAPDASGGDVRDAYILDESSITMPYLGSEGLTVLEIPVGVSGQLVRLFIVFMMIGLAVRAPSYSNKLRVRTALG